jgi:hypothetical protein
MAALERLQGVLRIIDTWGDLYDRRWGHRLPYVEEVSLDSEVHQSIDEVRQRARFARHIVEAMGERDLAERIAEHEEGQFGGHPFTRARLALVEAIAILTQREELAELLGPAGPQLSASELHPAIWGAAAALWDDGHYRAAVQAASSCLEGLLQGVAGPAVAGENLAALFSTNGSAGGEPRLRLRGLSPDSRTWRSAHDGAAALVRGAFMAVRNVVSHPGSPDPSQAEALEMLAILSYVARLVDNADVV